MLRRLWNVVVLLTMLTGQSWGQVENVPVSNQVYEYLDRMGVEGLLPLYSNTMIPLSRREVAGMLQNLEEQRGTLKAIDLEYLRKFRREFIHEIDPAREDAAVLVRDGFKDVFTEKEKYVYTYADSTASLYVEFLGTAEHRRINGDAFGSTHASFEQHGGRIRGTLKNGLGYYVQATNGALYGDKAFALSDPRLHGNVKFKDLGTPYFDFTEAYLRAELSWFNLQFGREQTLVGTGYSDRLLLSDNAPASDFIKLDAHYKSVRYLFLHASILPDSGVFPGLLVIEPSTSNKYLALHRVQFSLFDKMNVGISEMTVYQRFSPEFAYLNPIIFYKSVEHSLRDRDNSFLNFDFEVFPESGYKFYGTWLIDDIDFSKVGTGWWGNEFGWQGGMAVTDVAGVPNVDVVLEYTRLEPFVYSNRVVGNDYTHNNISLGHHLPPNSDEWFMQVTYRPARALRTWLSFTGTRHGENTFAGGQVDKNVGGSVTQGHRGSDPYAAPFLDGELIRTRRMQLRGSYEPINNVFLNAVYEFRSSTTSSGNTRTNDHYAAFQLRLEY